MDNLNRAEVRNRYVDDLVKYIAMIIITVIALVIALVTENKINAMKDNPDNYIEVTADKIDATSKTTENNDFGFLYTQQQAKQAGELIFYYNDKTYDTFEDYSEITTYKALYEFNLEGNSHKLSYTYDKEEDIPETKTIWIDKTKANDVNLEQSDILEYSPKVKNKASSITMAIIKYVIITILLIEVTILIIKTINYKTYMKKNKTINLSKSTTENTEAN